MKKAKFHREVLAPDQAVVMSKVAEVSRSWDAYLAGGSALALQLGHRRSLDFDWFTQRTIDPASLLKDVKSLGLPVQVRQNDEGTFLGHVGGVDFSVFRYPYGLVTTPVPFEGCHLASLEDIAAMKMTAVVQRATKRDYVDLHVLFEKGRVALSDVVATMQKKFSGIDPSTALRALVYFNDVEGQPMPEMLAKISWDDVKRGLVAVHERAFERRGRAR